MHRRDLVRFAALAAPTLSPKAQPPNYSVGERNASGLKLVQENQARSWLLSKGFVAFFGQESGPYVLVDGEPRDGRRLVAAQVTEVFAVPFSAVELASGHVVIGAHRKGFAPERCYAVLQGWSNQLVMVGLLHGNSGQPKSVRQKELNSALAASAATGVAERPLIPYKPRSFDSMPTLTVFTRVGQPVHAHLGQSLVEHVRKQLREEIEARERGRQEARNSGRTYGAATHWDVKAFKTEHREIGA